MKRSDIPVPIPCNLSWDTMSASGRARFCDACKAHVHDLSSMSEPEARAFLARREESVCVRYLADASSEVLFDLVPSGFVPVTRLVRRNAPSRALLGAVAAGVLALAACGKPEVVMGGFDFYARPPTVPDAPKEPAPDADAAVDPPKNSQDRDF